MKPGLLFDTHLHLLDLDSREGGEEGAAGLELLGGCVAVVALPSQWSGDTGAFSRMGPESWLVVRATGVHPWHSARAEAELERELALFRASLESSACRVVGEVGLDARKGAPVDEQVRLLLRQVEAAVELDLPCIFHVRGAWEQFFRLIAGFGRRGGPGIAGVVHGFSGSYELACRIIEAGLALGIGPALLRRNARRLPGAIRGLVRAYGVDSLAGRLVLESDAPYMAPSPLAVEAVCERLASLLGLSPSEAARRTARAALSLFHGGSADERGRSSTDNDGDD